MINRKVASFTLIEVTVAMLIASIGISVTYTAYTIVAKLYKDYTTKQEQISHVTLLSKLLTADFLTAEKIVRTPQGFLCDSPERKIYYIVSKDFIIRDQLALRVDTFSIPVLREGYSFNKQPVEFPGIVDEVNLSIAASPYIIPLKYIRQYSSQTLFEEYATN
jgi:prepilin-type N-terminal cleavage/methylation domain-containing protein